MGSKIVCTKEDAPPLMNTAIPAFAVAFDVGDPNTFAIHDCP
jgi:hypothetical protein